MTAETRWERRSADRALSFAMYRAEGWPIHDALVLADLDAATVETVFGPSSRYEVKP